MTKNDFQEFESMDRIYNLRNISLSTKTTLGESTENHPTDLNYCNPYQHQVAFIDQSSMIISILIPSLVFSHSVQLKL